MSRIRIEADGTTDLSRVYLWLSAHRGQTVDLDETRRVALGTPISGARAVIVAASVQDDNLPGPQLGGVLRALSNLDPRQPVRFAYDVRATAGLDAATVEHVGSDVVRAVSALIGEAQPAAKVA